MTVSVLWLLLTVPLIALQCVIVAFTDHTHLLFKEITCICLIDFELKKVLLPPPLGNFADISYLEENFKPHLLRDVCTLCSGALVSDSLLHMLL